MKILLINFMLMLVLNAGAADQMGESGFYTSADKKVHQSNEVAKLLAEFSATSPDKNILFYIHGRSQTLEQEWKNVVAMEQAYNVRVIMLHWESWNYLLGRPVANTLEGSRQLSLGLEQLSLFKKSQIDSNTSRKMFLMFHSMGNIVLKNYIEKFHTLKEEDLFDSIILTGADTPFTGHQKWLSQLKLGKDIYVVMNKKDMVLLASLTHDYLELDIASKNDDRLGLGRGFDNLFFLNTKTSPNAKYFDISGLTEGDHKHYLSTRSDVKDLFHYMLKENFEEIPLNFKVKKNYFKF